MSAQVRTKAVVEELSPSATESFVASVEVKDRGPTNIVEKSKSTHVPESSGQYAFFSKPFVFKGDFSIGVE